MAEGPAPAGAVVIVAEFEIKSGSLQRFLELARMDAAESVAKEPGCHQFDVTVDGEGDDRVVLYEVYDDQEAFDAHLETPHLKAFKEGIDDLVTGRRVQRLIRVHP
jgi:autoinducer 2-degrading protein